MSTQEYDNARQVDENILSSFNLKIENNLNEYLLLIIGINDDQFLSKNLSYITDEHCIKQFNDPETSLAFIHSLHDTNIFLIISGTFGRDYAHKFVMETQIVGIYVYCMNEDEHKLWTKKINKIRCTVSNATKLFNQLHRDIKQFSGRWPFNEKSFQKAVTSDSEWYNFFLLVICYRSQFIEESYKQMFEECRLYYNNNPSLLKKIDRFQQTYKSDNAIHEYTKDSFLYRIVNHALRTKNMKLIRKFSPFIRDLNSQIHKLHEEYYRSETNYIRVVYRGQYLSMDELEYLRTISKSNNSIITLTTFSSTSLDPEVALSYIPDMDGRIPCLFEIIIPDNYNRDEKDIPKYAQAFANISSISAFSDEQEVLFSLITNFFVKHVGYPTTQYNRSWVPIQLEFIKREKAASNDSRFNIMEWVGEEKDREIYIDVLDMLQVNAEDELKFKSRNWKKWWNILNKHSGKGLGEKQQLNLILYDCFTDDKHMSRKAIELYKVKLRSYPNIQDNSSSFPNLFREFNASFHSPAIKIAIYEDYLKQFCNEDTKEVVKCLWLVGVCYTRISDKECALECYEKALEINVDDKYQMNQTIQEEIKNLQKSPKKNRTTDNTERKSVIKNSNQEVLESYEKQQDLWLLYEVIKNEDAVKFSIEKRLTRILDYIGKRQEWYDRAESKIILRLPYEVTEDLSVNDYRCNFLSAAYTHISLGNSKMDAANNHTLSLWRYEKYMYDWMLCQGLQTFFKPFQNKSIYIRCSILPKLERFMKKLVVLISIVTVYICIEQGTCNINVNKILFINRTNPHMRHPIYVDLRESVLLARLEELKDENSLINETINIIPDDNREIFSIEFPDFTENLLLQGP